MRHKLDKKSHFIQNDDSTMDKCAYGLVKETYELQRKRGRLNGEKRRKKGKSPPRTLQEMLAELDEGVFE